MIKIMFDDRRLACVICALEGELRGISPGEEPLEVVDELTGEEDEE